MTIAVTGATGQLGRLVIDKLKAKAGEAIVGLVRSPANARELGVAVREADYAKPATLKSALAGVDVLLFISSREMRERAAQHHNVIEAAKAAGVKRIVYTSLLHADVSPMSLGVEHRATEAELKAAGVPHAILRNGWYTENHTASIGGAHQAALSSEAPKTASFRARHGPITRRPPSPRLSGQVMTAKRMSSPATTPIRFRTSPPRFRGRQAGPSLIRILPVHQYETALVGFRSPRGGRRSRRQLGRRRGGCGALFDDGRQLSALISRYDAALDRRLLPRPSLRRLESVTRVLRTPRRRRQPRWKFP